MHATTWISVMGIIEQKKSDTKSQILFVSICMNFPAKRIHADAGQNGGYLWEATSGKEAKEPTGSWKCSISQSGFWLHIVDVWEN